MKRSSASPGALAGLAGVTLSLALATGVWAQDPTPVTTPTAPVADVMGGPAALAEEIRVLRAIQPLRLTPDQLRALETAVAAGRERLAQQSQTDVRALAALREPVTRARQQLFTQGVTASGPQGAPALTGDRPVETARRTGEQNQRRVQDELATSLQGQLSTLLTPAQLGAIATQGRAMVASERLIEDRQRDQFRQQMQQDASRRAAASGGMPPGAADSGGRERGSRRGGPGGGPERMLERLRAADGEDFQRMSQGMARRFGDEGTPAYQNALAMFSRIRSMPDGQFRRERANMARQFDAAMTAPQSGAASVSVENATRAWIRRYLLSPLAPVALKSLGATKSGE